MKYMYEKRLEEAKEEGIRFSDEELSLIETIKKHTVDYLEVDAMVMLYRMSHCRNKEDREYHLAKLEYNLEMTSDMDMRLYWLIDDIADKHKEASEKQEVT